MPKVVKEYPITIGYRDTAAGVQKLEELSKRTGRPRAEVLRLLVQLAQPTDLPALQLVGAIGGAHACETAPS
jgi:hypothetical protein